MLNQEKSGKYIAEKRKQLGMTQKELADRVGLTDKAVSKWERGKSVPDPVILDEICIALKISLNEYLSGEDISEEHYPDKAEQNIKELITENGNENKNIKISAGILMLSFLLIIAGLYGFQFNPLSFVDAPSYLFFIGIVMVCIVLSGYFSDLLRIFFVFSKKRSYTDSQIKRTYEALRIVIILNIIVGISLTLTQMILFIKIADGSIYFTKSILLTLITSWYGFIFDIILLPVLCRLGKLNS